MACSVLKRKCGWSCCWRVLSCASTSRVSSWRSERRARGIPGSRGARNFQRDRGRIPVAAVDQGQPGRRVPAVLPRVEVSSQASEGGPEAERRREARDSSGQRMASGGRTGSGRSVPAPLKSRSRSAGGFMRASFVVRRKRGGISSSLRDDRQDCIQPRQHRRSAPGGAANSHPVHARGRFVTPNRCSSQSKAEWPVMWDGVSHPSRWIPQSGNRIEPPGKCQHLSAVNCRGRRGR